MALEFSRIKKTKLIRGDEFGKRSKWRKEYDWMDKSSVIEFDEATFFKYRGWVYYIGDFETVRGDGDFKEWDGKSNDTFFSGIVIKIDHNNISCDVDEIKVGTFCVVSDK